MIFYLVRFRIFTKVDVQSYYGIGKERFHCCNKSFISKTEYSLSNVNPTWFNTFGLTFVLCLEKKYMVRRFNKYSTFTLRGIQTLRETKPASRRLYRKVVTVCKSKFVIQDQHTDCDCLNRHCSQEGMMNSSNSGEGKSRPTKIHSPENLFEGHHRPSLEC